MKKEVIIILFFIQILGFTTKGQNNNLILTKEQNKLWFDSLKTLPLSQQIDFIKTRILNDTNVYNYNYHNPDRIIFDNYEREQQLKNKGNLADGRILYIVSYTHKLFKKNDSKGFIWKNCTESKVISRFHDFITSNKIKNIQIIKDEKIELELFGSIAGFGVITFELTEKKYLNEFDKLIKE